MEFLKSNFVGCVMGHLTPKFNSPFRKHIKKCSLEAFLVGLRLWIDHVPYKEAS